MDTLNLSLRQRKLLHLLQNRHGFTTCAELARELSVSPRTIRYDIEMINRELSLHHASISSERSKGYLYTANDPEKIRCMNQVDTAFYSREDRIRLLAFRLSLSEEPVNLYDLEDEIYVSRSTLGKDLQMLKKRYECNEPYIRIFRNGDNVCFERDERKIRLIMNHLLLEDWNYSKSENAFYKVQYLDQELMGFVLRETSRILHKFGILIEDPSLVALCLAITIMCQRTEEGHSLMSGDKVEWNDPQVAGAADYIFNALYNDLGLVFSQFDKDHIYLRILSGRIIDFSSLSLEKTYDDFEPEVIAFAEEYILNIERTFGLAFGQDEEFHLSLLLFLNSLFADVYEFQFQGNHNIIKKKYLIEYEIACLAQHTAIKFLGRELNKTELLYLAQCIYGAMENLQTTNPPAKLKTVICCHYNLPTALALKKRVMGVFGTYLSFEALLPVNAKDTYDFAETDIVLSTVKKNITDSPGTSIIYIESVQDYQDFSKISEVIRRKQLQQISCYSDCCLQDLLHDAFWHEQISADNWHDIINLLAGDFINNGYVPEEYVEDVIRRETVSTNAMVHGLVFLHSLIPSEKTVLSIAILKHPIVWKTRKIHIVVMGAFRPEHARFVFYLLHLFYPDHHNSQIRQIKTRQALTDHLSLY